MNPENTPTLQNDSNENLTKPPRQAPVNKVFLTIYGLMVLAFIIIFMVGSSGGDNSGLNSIALFVNGLYIVPAAFALVFVVHMIVLVIERQRNKSLGIQALPQPSSGLGSVVKALVIGVVLFFVGLMTFLLIMFQTR